MTGTFDEGRNPQRPPHSRRQPPRMRFVGRLRRRDSVWLLVNGDASYVVHPKWKSRGAVKGRLLLWCLERAGDRTVAIPARQQPPELLKAQPGRRFPPGLYVRQPTGHPKTGHQHSQSQQARAIAIRAAGWAGSRIDPGRVPAAGPQIVRGGLPGLGRGR